MRVPLASLALFAALAALVFAAPAQAIHGANEFSGSWTTNIGGVNFFAISESQGASDLQSLNGQPCGAPTTYYGGDYYDANNTGKIVACERSAGHLVGRYVENRSSDPTGDGDIDITFQRPNQFSGHYTGDNFPGQTFPYSGTFQTHIDGDGCCPATEPSPPSSPGDPGGQTPEEQPGPCQGTRLDALVATCFTVRSGPGLGKVASVKAPKVGPKIREVAGLIHFIDDNGDVFGGPPVVSFFGDTPAGRNAGALCFMLLFNRAANGAADSDASLKAFLTCREAVARILLRYDQILERRKAKKGAAARPRCFSRIVRNRKARRVKPKLRVTCTRTASGGVQVRIRPRSRRQSLRKALGGRPPKVLVGRSRFDPPGRVRTAALWSAK